MRASRGLRVFLLVACLVPKLQNYHKKTETYITLPTLLYASLFLSLSPPFFLDQSDLIKIYRQTTTKHRRSSRLVGTKGRAEASCNCGTQIVKLIMSSIHGFFIDVDFLRNDTNQLLSDLSSLTTIFSSRSSSKAGLQRPNQLHKVISI